MANHNVEFICDHMVIMVTVDVPPDHFAGWDNGYDIDHEIMMMANSLVHDVYNFEPRDWSFDYQIHEMD